MISSPRGLDEEIMQRFYQYLTLYGREDIRP
jgi:hypothetical protein